VTSLIHFQSHFSYSFSKKNKDTYFNIALESVHVLYVLNMDKVQMIMMHLCVLLTVYMTPVAKLVVRAFILLCCLLSIELLFCC